MAAESHTTEVCYIYSLVVRAMVGIPDAVTVEGETSNGSTVILVRVAPSDVGKVIGNQGRNSRALRQILRTISKSRGHSFTLDIGENIAFERCESSQS